MIVECLLESTYQHLSKMWDVLKAAKSKRSERSTAKYLRLISPAFGSGQRDQIGVIFEGCWRHILSPN